MSVFVIFAPSGTLSWFSVGKGGGKTNDNDHGASGSHGTDQTDWTSSPPQLEVTFLSPTKGYVQTPGWDGTTGYPTGMDSTVTVNVTEDHAVMLSFHGVDLPPCTLSSRFQEAVSVYTGRPPERQLLWTNGFLTASGTVLYHTGLTFSNTSHLIWFWTVLEVKTSPPILALVTSAVQYCLPVHVRCNRVRDCSGGEDEKDCGRYTCPGFYRCRDSRICLHPHFICDGVAQCPQSDDELLCDLTCPASCTCYGLAFICTTWSFPAASFPNLRYIDASGTDMRPEDFEHNRMLIHLRLARLTDFLMGVYLAAIGITDRLYQGFVLSVIPLLPVTSHWEFYSQTGLCVPIPLTNTSFAGYGYFFGVVVVVEFVTAVFVGYVESPRILVDNTTTYPAGMSHTVRIAFSRVEFLSVAILTHKRKRKKTGFRILFTFHEESVGLQKLPDGKWNCTVPHWADFQHHFHCNLVSGLVRCVHTVNSVNVMNALVAKTREDCPYADHDICAPGLVSADGSCFLYVTPKASVTSGNEAYKECALRGARLASVNTKKKRCDGKIDCVNEADEQHCARKEFMPEQPTIPSPAIISYDFQKDLFLGLRELETVSADNFKVCCPATLPEGFNAQHCHAPYDETGICTPLPFTTTNFPGHRYSFGVMIVLNFVVFLSIATGQAFIVWSVRQNTISASDTSRQSQDTTIARRLLTVVVSDFLCWFPIGLLGIMASTGTPIPGEVNVAMAIIALPVNSALNPFLYTLNILLEKRRRKIEACHKKALAKTLTAEAASVEATEAPDVVHEYIPEDGERGQPVLHMATSSQ
nr:hypothetical protein BaRGS_002670 [Batillaria attramentaria]